MFVYTENGTLVNLNNAKRITCKPYKNNTYAVIADDTDVLAVFDSADEACREVADIAYGIEHCKRVYFIGEVPMPF